MFLARKESSGWRKIRTIQTTASDGFGQNTLPGSPIHRFSPQLAETSAQVTARYLPACLLLNYSTHQRYVPGFKKGAWAFISRTLRLGLQQKDSNSAMKLSLFVCILTLTLARTSCTFFSIGFYFLLIGTYRSTMCHLIQLSFVWTCILV
jgi:hypothetical protein